MRTTANVARALRADGPCHTLMLSYSPYFVGAGSVIVICSLWAPKGLLSAILRQEAAKTMYEKSMSCPPRGRGVEAASIYSCFVYTTADPGRRPGVMYVCFRRIFSSDSPVPPVKVRRVLHVIALTLGVRKVVLLLLRCAHGSKNAEKHTYLASRPPVFLVSYTLSPFCPGGTKYGEVLCGAATSPISLSCA